MLVPRLVLAMLACWLVVSPLLGAPPPALKPDLRKDERLAKEISFNGEAMPMHRALRAVRDTAGVFVSAQGELLRRPVAIAARKKSCVLVMEDLALLFDAAWVYRQDQYMLIADKDLAKQVAAYPARVSTAAQEAELLRSLTQVQLESLRGAGVVPLAVMGPEQKQLALADVRDRYLRRPDRFLLSVVTGEGVRLVCPARLAANRPSSEPGPAPAGPPTLRLDAPAIGEDGSTTPAPLFEVPFQ
jgi:hypothetical protein